MIDPGTEEGVARLHRGYWIAAALLAVVVAGAYRTRSSRCTCDHSSRVAAVPAHLDSSKRIRHRGVIPAAFRQLVRSVFDAEVEGGKDGRLRVRSAACSQAAAERVIAATRKTDLVEGGFVELLCFRDEAATPDRVALLGEAGLKRLAVAGAIEKMRHTRGLLIDEVGISDAGADGTTLVVVSQECANLKLGNELNHEVMRLAATVTAPERPGFTSIRCESSASTGPLYMSFDTRAVATLPR